MNKGIFIGNLGKDAEIRTLEGGSVAISFSVAINEGYKDKQGNQVDKTTWVNCTIWKTGGQSTAIAKYLTKGTKVCVEGTVSCRAYMGTASTTPQASLDLKVGFVELLGSKNDGQNQNAGGGYPQQQQAQTNTVQPGAGAGGDFPDIEEDLPF